MNETIQKANIVDPENLGESLQEGGPSPHVRGCEFLFALGNLEFKPLAVSDPVPLGRQILEAAGLKPDAGYSLFCILPSGDFEDVRLNETFDLRENGVERFIAFFTDRTFKLMLNDAQIEWGEAVMKGAVLYELGNMSAEEAVFLEVRGGTDRLIDPHETIDLAEPGVERFVTASKQAVTFEVIVNSRPRTVSDRRVTFEQVVQLAYPGQHNADVTFSMTFRHANSKPHSGVLSNEGCVEVKPEGTIFNVNRTVQS